MLSTTALVNTITAFTNLELPCEVNLQEHCASQYSPSYTMTAGGLYWGGGGALRWPPSHALFDNAIDIWKCVEICKQWSSISATNGIYLAPGLLLNVRVFGQRKDQREDMVCCSICAGLQELPEQVVERMGG